MIAESFGVDTIDRTAYFRSMRRPSMCDFDGAGRERVGSPIYCLA